MTCATPASHLIAHFSSLASSG